MPEQTFTTGDDICSSCSTDDVILFGRNVEEIAGLRSSSKISIDAASTLDASADYTTKAVMTYDQFCLMLRRSGDDEDMGTQDEEVSKTKKFSFVSRWRSKVDPIEIGPPSSPSITSEFPSSPVAVIHPTELHITSLPPYDCKTASRLAGRSFPESSSETTIDRPTHFYDLYDAELECMIDEATEVESSPSVSSISAAVYVPPARHERTPRRKISSIIRWLPTRIKYTFLSSSIHKSFRK